MNVDVQNTLALVDKLLGDIEENQARKVIELARRIKPGLTAEDIRNPHDFPELNDPDWHYEDGVLTGIQGARVALRAHFHADGPSEGAS